MPGRILSMKAKVLPGGQKKMAGVLRKAEMNIAAMTFRLRASWVRSLMEETREIR